MRAATVVKAYTEDTTWRNRDQFLRGRGDAEAFLTRKWEREHLYMCVQERREPSGSTA
jgi:nuclear transport factor 2 (NTF2) superfamily protein